MRREGTRFFKQGEGDHGGHGLQTLDITINMNMEMGRLGTFGNRDHEGYFRTFWKHMFPSQ